MPEHGSRPNIVLMVADDLGDRDLGCYGNPGIRTGNLDRLARDGVSFTSAFVTISSCSPSRSSFFSGRYPHATGAEDLHSHLPADIPLLPSLLREGGYFTANVGKFHLGPNVTNQFDRLDDDEYAWREVLESRPAGRPFFLSVCFHDPHRGYEPGAIPDPTDPADVIVPPYLPDDSRVRADLAMYYDEVVRMDREIGRITGYLESEGLAGETVVIFFSDNGMPFPRAKTTCYDSGCRTPFIVRWPGRTPASAVCDQLFSTVDLAPSLLALACLEPESGMQGRDLHGLFLDPVSRGREYVHLETNWHDLDDHVRAVRDSRYKYIRNYFPRDRLVVPLDALTSPSYEAMLELRESNRLTAEQMRLFVAPRAAEELYDTLSDPFEFTNLAGDANYAALLERMRAECDRWITETGDVSPTPRKVDLMDIHTGEMVRPDILGQPPPPREEEH